MIIGIGTDLCDIRRIEKALQRFGEKFEMRVFTQTERNYANIRAAQSPHNSKAASYAKRFAAKEAVIKALSAGGKSGQGISWQDIEIINSETGKPEIRLHGKAQDRLDMLSYKRATKIHLSLSDEHPYAQAFIIIETL